MRIGALILMEKHLHYKISKGWTLGAWHSRHSITWRWLLHYIPGCYWLRLFKHRHNVGVYFDLFTPLGRFNFQTQQSMPWPKHHYRPELHRSRDDRVDAMAYMMQGLKSNPTDNSDGR